MRHACLALLALTGCHAILGIDEPGLASVDADVADAAPPDAGPPEFTFTIVESDVTVPLGGAFNIVDVRIERLGSFVDAVDVTVDMPEPGLTFTPLEIPAGSDTAELHLGASGLSLDTTFTITLKATSGALVHSDTIMARVTGETGTLDDRFGSSDVPGVAHALIDDGGALQKFARLPNGSFAGSGYVFAGGVQRSSVVRYSADGMTVEGASANLCGCGFPEQGYAVSALADSSFVTAAMSMPNFPGPGETVLRAFDAAGVPVDAFGTAGRFDLQLDGKQTDVFDMVTVGDDVIMLVRVDGTRYELVRLDPATGTVDTSFGVAGRAATDIEVLSLNPLAVDGDNRIWIVGQEISSGSQVAQIQCRTTNGILDPAWGGDGVVEIDSGMAERGAAITFDDADRVYVATELGEDMMGTLTVRRFMPDGTVDTTWGTNGIALPGNTEEGTNGAYVYDMEIQPDGRIVVLGQHSTFWLARFRKDGRPDPTLGVMGILTLDTLNLESPIFSNLEIDAEGMLLLGGGFGPNFAQSAIFKLWF